MSNNKGKQKRKTATNAGLAGAASEVVSRFGEAASEHIKGYQGEFTKDGKFVKGLKDIAQSKENSYANLKQQAGFSGEILYENRINAEKIIQKSTDRIKRTDTLGDTNHQQFDHVRTDSSGNPILDNHGNYTDTAQMKLRGHYDYDTYVELQKAKDPNWTPPKNMSTETIIQSSAEDNVNQLIRQKEFLKYKDADHIDIPTEQMQYAKKHLENRAKSLQEQIDALEKNGNNKALKAKQAELERVQSVDKRIRKSVDSADAMNARLRPRLQTVKEVHKVATKAGLQQAKIGAIVGGTISVSQSIISYASGEEKDIKKLSLNVGKDVAGAASLSFATGYSGTVIKSAMERSKKQLFQNLSKSNMPALIATSTWEVGKSLKKYLTYEECSELELIEELGEKGTGMMAASMGAAIGTAILPVFGTVVGGVVGGMAGYMTGSILYNSAIDLLKDERLSDANRQIVEEIANEAIQTMQTERASFNTLVSEHLADRQDTFDRCFSAIDASVKAEDHEGFNQALNELAITFGIELQFIDFNEFDDFMSDDSIDFKF